MSDLASDIYVARLKRIIDSLPPINLADWEMRAEFLPPIRLTCAPCDCCTETVPTDSEGEE